MSPTIVWACWLGIMVLGTFGLLEGSALVSKKSGDTFSETLRRWLGITPRRWWRPIGMISFLVIFGGFSVWFLGHILLGWA